MRTLGALLIAVGIFGFVYASDQHAKAPPLPEDIGWREGLRQPAGQWDTLRYAGAAGAFIGAVLLLAPKGR
jgi:hypothetical protein